MAIALARPRTPTSTPTTGYAVPRKSPADLEREAAERALLLQKQQQHYDRWLEQATIAARQPYLNMAMEAQGGISDWNPPAYVAAAPFQAPDRAQALADPYYQFLLRQGSTALGNRSSAQGTSGTGGSLKELQSFRQASAQDQYDKVYGREQDAYTLAETLRGQAYDRDAQAGYQTASLRNQAASMRAQQYLGLAGLALPGEYPGYPGEGEGDQHVNSMGPAMSNNRSAPGAGFGNAPIFQAPYDVGNTNGAMRLPRNTQRNYGGVSKIYGTIPTGGFGFAY